MIECIFTIDYEIYGNGEGSLRELVHDPTERLADVFKKYQSKFVAFIEVAELEMIEANKTDRAIDMVKHQIKKLYGDGFELGLHLHPQWYNARYANGKWQLDYSEYNLCMLSQERIAQIIERSIIYLRDIVDKSDFTPLSFRAGNWLFQPSKIVARILSEQGIKVDSSVFKGGIHHQYKLDYRRALLNGNYWTFTEHVDIPDPNGLLLELPIYTQMVPFWKMITAKNIGMQKKSFSSVQNSKKEIYHLLDFLRFWQPLKLDFCRMTINQLINMVDKVIKEDQKTPASFKPLVAIGHTKDLVDFEIIEHFLSYLERKRIAVSTFKDIYRRCKN